MNENNEAEEERIDLAGLIEEMRMKGHVPPDALAKIEQSLKTFERNVSLAREPEILEQAFGFGLIMGSYVDTADRAQKAIELFESYRQSAAGRASGEARQTRPWHEHAKELALAIRSQDPSASQDKVASEIELRWKMQNIECPTHPTLKAFISQLEKDGDLPRRQPKLKA